MSSRETENNGTTANSSNPLFNKMRPKWIRGSDSYEGSDQIKSKNTSYLPATSGQTIEARQLGTDVSSSPTYKAYKARAVYPDIYKDAIDATVGIMHRKPPIIELPTQMEDMLASATLLNEPLDMVLRIINTRQLMTGRIGLFGDVFVNKENKSVPVLHTYVETAVPNWKDTEGYYDRENLDIVVLDESRYEMSDSSLTWEFKNKYKVLALVEGEGPYKKGDQYGFTEVEELNNLENGIFSIPNVQGRTLDTIPFVFINAKDLSPTPDLPPFEGLAISALGIYRGEADYRQSLFMQGQDTLVRIGVNVGSGDEEAVQTGVGARIDVPMGGDVKYVGVESAGLPEQRMALENDYKRAEQKAGRLISGAESGVESGEALKIRVAAQTANIPTVAKAGAAGLEKVLKDLARWFGYDETKVKVTPNLDFTEADLNGKTLLELIQSKALGGPISNESIHGYMREQGVTKQTLESELALIASEPPSLVVPPLGGDN